MRKVIDIEERIPSMREKRKRRANRKFIFILVVFFIALLSVLYFQSSLSRIDTIKVVGATIHEESVYRETSELQSGNSIWGFSKEKVSNRLTDLTGVKEITVTRKWLRDIEITVIEWQPVAYIESNDGYGLLLENGTVFEQDDLLLEEDAPILNGFTSAKEQNRIAEQLLKMENNVYQLISEIIYAGSEHDPDYITVFMDDGYEIKAIIPTLAEKMMYYSEIVAQLNGEEKGVIDMEVGTFFTPYSQIYGTEEIIEEDDEGE